MKRLILSLLVASMLAGCVTASMTTTNGTKITLTRWFMQTDASFSATMPSGEHIDFTYGSDVSTQTVPVIQAVATGVAAGVVAGMKTP